MSLEEKVEKSKISRIVDEFKQWREPQNKPYFDHYLSNAFKILFGEEPINYKEISHKNKIVHSYFYDRRENKVSNAYFYDFEDKGEK